MSRKTTGTAGTTRRRVAVGTALLSATALLGASFASATAASAGVGVSDLVVFGQAAGTAPVGPLRGLNSTLQVTGTHLDDVTTVWFGSAQATHLVRESDTLIYVTPPASSATGTVAVKYGTGSQDATSAADLGPDYTYTAAPVISTVVPSVDHKTVTINGSQLTGATSVLFGDALVKVDAKTANANDAHLTVKAPAIKSGAVDVSVVTPNGLATKTAAYGAVPTISKILPNLTKGSKAIVAASAATGTVAVASTSATSTVATYASDTGTVVLMTGSGFSGLQSVKFGHATADAVVVSDTILRVRIPAKSSLDSYDAKNGVVAKVDVVVTNSVGSSKAAKFSYDNAPTVTAASDVVGATSAGTNTVTLTGHGLTGAKVTFGGKAGKTTASTDTSATITVAKNTGGGDVDVKVTTAAGYFVLPVKYGYKSVDTTVAWPTVTL